MSHLLKRRAFIRGLGLLGAGWAVQGWPAPLRTVPFPASHSQTSETRNLMGTFVTITLFHSSRDQAQEALGAAFQYQEKLIRLYDRHDPHSALGVLNERGSLTGPPPELVALLNRSRSIHYRTGGRFDVTVKPLLDLYESGKEKGRLPSKQDIRDALTCVGIGGLMIDPHKIAFSREGMGITLDGIAKGTIVDETIAFLRKKGIRQALVDAGGDLRVMGGRGDGWPWRIVVYDPTRDNNDGEMIFLRDGAVATSGNYLVYFDREKVHHHILSPESGASPSWSIGATILDQSSEKADALATALMLFSPAEGLAFVNGQKGSAALLLNREGGKMVSEQWPKTKRTL